MNQLRKRFWKKQFQVGTKFLALFHNGRWEWIELNDVNIYITDPPTDLLKIIVVYKDNFLYNFLDESQRIQ